MAACKFSVSPILRRLAPSIRHYATAVGSSLPAKAHHRVVVVGGGSAGVTVAAQLRRTQELNKPGDVAILDPASVHHYQPGWTLVGSGLRGLNYMQRPMKAVIPPGVQHYPVRAQAFDPANNLVHTAEGVDVSYDYLVVAPGLEVNFGAVSGLEQALGDPTSQVSSIYSDRTVEQAWENIRAFRGGKAVFTQPAGIIKCAGAPQKLMWMALSQWARDNVRGKVDATFATGAPKGDIDCHRTLMGGTADEAMFAVAKYSAALEALRKERNVEGLFQHNLVSLDAQNKIATFKNLADGGKEVQKNYDFLHVVPPQKPYDWLAKSALTNSAGWVEVDESTTQHVKFPNVFSLGDASSLPNSKTAAAITRQAPVLVFNLVASIQGKNATAAYDGYTSCPLLTGHGELMLCEFKYGGVPQETFAGFMGDQETPRRFFYHLKKDFFPWIYWSAFLKGSWYGPSGVFKPVS